MSNYCTADQIKNDVGETSSQYNDLFEALAEAVSDLIDSECQRNGRLHYRQVTELFDVEARQKRFFPKNTPVVSVSGLQVRNEDEYVDVDIKVYAYPEYVELEESVYVSGSNIYNLSDDLHKDFVQGLKIIMTVGFFPENNIPKGLNMLCRQIAAKEFYRNTERESSNVKSKKIGNYSVTYKSADEISGSMSGDLQNSSLIGVLDQYRKSLIYGTIS